MLFMMVEHFKKDARLIGERFQSSARMMPEGVTYHASWVDPAGARCYQIMEAERPELISEWTSHWDDLVDFEIVPVVTSNDFWASR
jgi:hypothetical protein